MTGDDDYPAWLDEERYPFQGRYLEFEPGTLHYVDEGDGRPVLLLHGNPTWSFLFRHLVSALSDRYRCVAPDHFGFGLSDKPVDWSYRPADHARIVANLVEELDLTDLTLVIHDWGGPIGLDYATRNPENVHSVVLLNTFGWPIERLGGRAFGAVLGSRVGRFLIRRYNFFANTMMKVVVADRSSLPPEIHRHYTAPLATPDDREASWVLPRELNGSKAWLADLWERRDRIEGKPMLLAWGLADPTLGSQLGRWQEAFPDAETVEFPDVGHHVPEEAGTDLVAPVEEFLGRA